MAMTTVLVTGGSGGIGLAIAKRFAATGYDVVLAARSRDKLDAAATALAPARVETIIADLATPAGPGEVLGAVERAGMTVDVLVNNAGVGLFGPFAETALERELAMVQLNVASVLALTKACLPGMLARRRGHVVNVASVAAFLPGPYQSVYYATKAFVLSFSEALAEELRESGVAVTAVCPGPTATGFHAAAEVRRARPLERGLFLTADRVADATLDAVRLGRRLEIPGWRQRLMVSAIQFAPRRLVARLSALASRPAEQPAEGGH
jgi:short-subunit dehydrogenase